MLHLQALIGGLPARLSRIGPPERDGLRQLIVPLPKDIAAGLHPVELTWFDRPLCREVSLRVVPPGPDTLR